MSGRPKIMIIENAVSPTGSLFSILRSSVSLKDRFSFEFVLPKGSTAIKIVRDLGFKVHELRMRELRHDWRSMICYLPALLINAFVFRKLLRTRKVQLVVNNDFYNLLPPLLCMTGERFPYVTYVRFMPSKFPPALTGIWHGLHLKYASKVIAVSHAVKRELPNSREVVVVHNELPDRHADLRTVHSKLILYAGNFIKGKGQEFALEAFCRIANAYPEWKLRFVGGDMGLAKNTAFRNELERRAQSFACGAAVQWMDFSEDLAAHYLESAFTLNFSASESFSLTTLEAQFYGRPVIATRCGGPEEIIDDGVTGMLVPINDVNAMASAIEYLITHPEECQRMGERAYHHVREKFSAENTIEKLGAIYRAAIEK